MAKKSPNKKSSKKATKTASKAAKPSTKASPLDAVLKGLTQTLGAKAGGVASMVGFRSEPDYFISTSISALDKYGLTTGGLPGSRISEVFGGEGSGKTSFVYACLASVQAMGGIAVLIHSEEAGQLARLPVFGVDTDKLVLIECGAKGETITLEEVVQAIQGVIAPIAAMKAKDRPPVLVAVDSLAATGTAEEHAAGGVAQFDKRAKTLSAALRVIPSVVAKAGAHLLMVNQNRTKIGVMFGCFSYETSVLLEDGSTMKIGKIVNQKLPVRVKSFDPETGEVSSKQVVDWHDNGPTDTFLHFTFGSARGGNGANKIHCTPDHQILVPGDHGTRKFVPAKDIHVGEIVYSPGEYLFNEHQTAVAKAHILGCGGVKYSGSRSRVYATYSGAAAAYTRWKFNLFGKALAYEKSPDKAGLEFGLCYTCDLLHVMDGPHLIKEAGVRGVAIWCMDKGMYRPCKTPGKRAHFNGSFELRVSRWDEGQMRTAAKHFDKLGLGKPTITRHGFLWSGKRTMKLMTGIAPYLPEFLADRVHPDVRGSLGDREWNTEVHPREKLVPVRVLERTEGPVARGSSNRYDLTIEGNHTYFAGACAVHNSPTTTPGGHAPKYHASTRIELFGGKAVLTKGEPTGKQVTFKIWKHKLGRPLRKVVTRLDFSKGWDDGWTSLHLARDWGLFSSRTGSPAMAHEALEGVGWDPSKVGVSEEEVDGESFDPVTGEVIDAKE